MIIDSHCHLDNPELFEQLEDVVNRAKFNKVEYMLTICTTLESFAKIEFITSKYKNIYGTFGIHPHETKNYKNIDIKYILNKVKNNNKIIGIGESGLDFYYNHSDKEVQKKSFINHIEAASRLDIPLIVHSRGAEKDTYEILKSEKKNSDFKALLHCFTGSKDFAKKLLDINCYISLSGIITFKNSNNLIDAISIIPNNKLLVETDSPYLSPVPLRGKLNEPSHIVHTISKLAEIKKVTEKDLIKNTSDNFLNIFNIH